MRRVRLSLDRAGMTLLEVVVAMLIFGLMVSAAFAYINQQAQAITLGDQRMRVLQNQRFAANTLEKDLRSVGTGVPEGQPFLVYADSQVIAFNADLVTTDPEDRYAALYVDPSASDAEVVAATEASRFVIPGAPVSYPDTSYVQDGVNSPAETITFFFSRDSTTERTDDFVLLRQVNHLDPVVVARDLVRSGAEPFFEYFRILTPTQGASRLELIPSDRLLHHAAKTHGSASDVGAGALIDSVRAVRINLTATNGVEGVGEQSRALSRLVRLPNAGAQTVQACGAEPLLSTVLSASTYLDAGQPVVRLDWSQAVDESDGEQDVLRYVVWRTTVAGEPWGNPYSSLAAAGTATYTFEDYGVEPGATYYYGVAAQDCSPALSDVVSASVTAATPPPEP